MDDGRTYCAGRRQFLQTVLLEGPSAKGLQRRAAPDPHNRINQAKRQRLRLPGAAALEDRSPA